MHGDWLDFFHVQQILYCTLCHWNEKVNLPVSARKLYALWILMFSEISAGKSRELTKKFTEFPAGQISSIQYSVHTVQVCILPVITENLWQCGLWEQLHNVNCALCNCVKHCPKSCGTVPLVKGSEGRAIVCLQLL